MATYWLIVGTPENYEKSAAMGWTLAGIKSRHRKKAERMQPGDKIVSYLTRVKAIGSIVTIVSTYFEDAEPTWISEKPGELYPFRVRTEPDLVLTMAEALPAQPIAAQLEYTKRWPPEHWTLAFQGNVHVLEASDYEMVRKLVAQRAALVPA